MAKRIEIRAESDSDWLEFNCLSDCIKHFEIGKNRMYRLLSNGEVENGWTFTQINKQETDEYKKRNGIKIDLLNPPEEHVMKISCK